MEFLVPVPAHDPEDGRIAVILCPHFRVCTEDRFLPADLLQFFQRVKDPALNTGPVFDLFHQVPVEFPSVDIAGIRRLIRIFFVSIIIDLAHLIAAVEHRDP